MKHYIDITLIPSSDIAPNFIMEKVYKKVHHIIVNLQSLFDRSAVAVAFPEHSEKNQTLGLKVRIFSKDRAILDAVSIKDDFSQLSDYVHVSGIRDVPNKTGFAMYGRPSRTIGPSLFRRLVRRGNCSSENLLLLEGKIDQRKKCGPFVNLKSSSNGHNFRLDVQIKKADHEILGFFDSYGLSNSATVPVF